jgi:hypothetical protein
MSQTDLALIDLFIQVREHKREAQSESRKGLLIKLIATKLNSRLSAPSAHPQQIHLASLMPCVLRSCSQVFLRSCSFSLLNYVFAFIAVLLFHSPLLHSKSSLSTKSSRFPFSISSLKASCASLSFKASTAGCKGYNFILF